MSEAAITGVGGFIFRTLSAMMAGVFSIFVFMLKCVAVMAILPVVLLAALFVAAVIIVVGLSLLKVLFVIGVAVFCFSLLCLFPRTVFVLGSLMLACFTAMFALAVVLLVLAIPFLLIMVLV